jgi:flagellar basal body-associated protein FliL
VIPWLIVALVVVPLMVVAFVAARRRTVAGEHTAGEDAQTRAQMEQQFEEAEAFQAKWRQEDRARHDQEYLP